MHAVRQVRAMAQARITPVLLIYDSRTRSSAGPETRLPQNLLNQVQVLEFRVKRFRV